MTIFIFLGLVVVIALFSAFLILFITKVGAREGIIQRSPKLISKLFACDFCLSFWVAAFIIAVISLATLSLDLVLIPLLSTPITRILL